MFSVIILLLTLLIITTILSKFGRGGIIIFLITLGIVYFVFLFLQYTPDRQFYEYWLGDETLRIGKEPFFQLVAWYVEKNGYNYVFLHILFISVYSVLLLLFIKKITKNLLLVVVIYLPLIFIFFATQLRYFLGLYAVFLGLYYILVEKKKLPGIFFLMFAILSHYSLILFLPFILINRINIEHYLNRIVRTALIVFFTFTLLSGLIVQMIGDLRFKDYFSVDLASSFAGGFFTFGPYLIMYLLIQLYYKVIVKRNPQAALDSKFVFLYKLSLYPLIFFGVALTLQVVGHRVIISTLVLPILFYIYGLSFVKLKSKKLVFNSIFALVICLLFFHLNFASDIFFKNKNLLTNDISKMLLSNKYLKYILE